MTKDESNKLNEALLVSPTSNNADLERADKKLGPSSSASSPKSSNKPKHGPFMTAIHALLLDSLFNILLLAVPLAISGNYLGWNPALIFILSLVALCPLAERLSFVTEEMAKYTNSTVGGLLNATFGNMTEVIVGVMALRAGKLWIVQLSLLGSILSNALLVLGTAFLIGGFRFETQTFNKAAASTNTSLMMLSVTSLMIPSIMHATGTVGDGDDTDEILGLSRYTSIVLLVSYGLFLVFQLKTHTRLFEEGEDEEEEEAPLLSFVGGLVALAVATFFISLLSSYLVDFIEEASDGMGIPKFFIGTILLPIAGNACEHTAAIIFAYKNKMAVSLGIAIGSVVQIAIMVIPTMVVIGWGIGQPLSLDFHPFQTVTIFVATLLVAFIVQDGTSNWLQGLLLIMAYAIISGGYWIHSDPSSP